MSADATAVVEIERFAVVDGEGNYAVGADAARRSYADNVGALEGSGGFVMLELSVTVPLPRVVRLSGLVPEAGSPATLIVK
jgi:hypothetical protein